MSLPPEAANQAHLPKNRGEVWADYNSHERTVEFAISAAQAREARIANLLVDAPGYCAGSRPRAQGEVPNFFASPHVKVKSPDELAIESKHVDVIVSNLQCSRAEALRRRLYCEAIIHESNRRYDSRQEEYMASIPDDQP